MMGEGGLALIDNSNTFLHPDPDKDGSFMSLQMFRYDWVALPFANEKIPSPLRKKWMSLDAERLVNGLAEELRGLQKEFPGSFAWFTPHHLDMFKLSLLNIQAGCKANRSLKEIAAFFQPTMLKQSSGGKIVVGAEVLDIVRSCTKNKSIDFKRAGEMLSEVYQKRLSQRHVGKKDYYGAMKPI